MNFDSLNESASVAFYLGTDNRHSIIELILVERRSQQFVTCLRSLFLESHYGRRLGVHLQSYYVIKLMISSRTETNRHLLPYNVEV